MCKKSLIVLICLRHELLDIILHMCLNMNCRTGNSTGIRNREKNINAVAYVKIN
jgi:hypothetical protein